ncbi:hypothetical protein [Roseisalinus antarcticus]|uniref:Uncharacterized protein n=1 Tax=Roseisalinus antarcticus TaxID=254357 RepID=A0A1Y5S1X4_9RHOB|nr:hypothetical protein [Roseisalinus antarcticus]SLN28073.1 hypothetical protein ROA7023_00932 [Roseisalinus antarcticus]
MAVSQRIFAALLASNMAVGAACAQEATYVFEWIGDGGYKMQGAMSFDADLATAPFVDQDDISCFVIEGFVADRKVGRWALSDLAPETTWILTFLPDRSEFAVSHPSYAMPQGWNMNGRGDDCGPGGFGFNLGNLGQDLCLDNELHEASRVGSYRPFKALRDDDAVLPADACAGIIPTS